MDTRNRILGIHTVDAASIAVVTNLYKLSSVFARRHGFLVGRPAAGFRARANNL